MRILFPLAAMTLVGLTGCTQSDRATRNLESESHAYEAGRKAHEAADAAERAVDKAGKKIEKAARDVEEGWKDADREKGKKP